MTYELSGLVVRTVDLSGRDKLLTILTAERGLVTAVANGSRSLKSRYLAATQQFCYAKFLNLTFLQSKKVSFILHFSFFIIH